MFFIPFTNSLYEHIYDCLAKKRHSVSIRDFGGIKRKISLQKVPLYLIFHLLVVITLCGCERNYHIFSILGLFKTVLDFEPQKEHY